MRNEGNIRQPAELHRPGAGQACLSEDGEAPACVYGHHFIISYCFQSFFITFLLFINHFSSEQAAEGQPAEEERRGAGAPFLFFAAPVSFPFFFFATSVPFSFSSRIISVILLLCSIVFSFILLLCGAERQEGAEGKKGQGRSLRRGCEFSSILRHIVDLFSAAK